MTLASPLDILTRYSTADSHVVCGIMTGTSVDAVDVVIARIRGGGLALDAEILHSHRTLFPEEVRDMIFANSSPSTSSVSDICLLHAVLAEVYADAVHQTCREWGHEISDLDLVGIHGQTLYHIPEPVTVAGYSIRSTFQAGNGSMLARLLGLPVVSDFRSADIAAGGQGAPLVPYVDYLLFRSEEEDRIMLNIGGIANLTCLPAGGGEDEIFASDVGPGYMLVDQLMRKFYGKEFDEGGKIAGSGRINPDLKAWILSHEFFSLPFPKSTGREVFGERFMDNYLELAREFQVSTPEDLVATAAQATVTAISRVIAQLAGEETATGLYVSGGGAFNEFFLTGLRHSLPQCRVRTSDALGVPPDLKEALAFAILAHEWMQGHPANLPAVTGASQRAILGSFAIG